MDSRFAQKARQRAFDRLFHDQTDVCLRHIARLRDTVDLEKGRLGADMGIESRGGGRHLVGRDGAARCRFGKAFYVGGDATELGRGSCMDRGCQDVWVSVLSVSIEKKKNS